MKRTSPTASGGSPTGPQDHHDAVEVTASTTRRRGEGASGGLGGNSGVPVKEGLAATVAEAVAATKQLATPIQHKDLPRRVPFFFPTLGFFSTPRSDDIL